MACEAGECEECAEYEKKIREVCDGAISHIKKLGYAQVNHVIIFDVDGTSLDDRRSKRVKGSMPKHVPVYDFYVEASRFGYEIIFLTGRLRNEDAIRNLEREGYQPENIIFRPMSVAHNAIDIGVWKDFVRGELAKSKHIVACIGDQPMDVEGTNIGDIQFRLPDPPVHQQGCTIS